MSVSIGSESAQIANLLSDISSSEAIRDRLDQWNAAKKAADDAYARLRIGEDARAAYDEADKRWKEENAKLAEADKRLDAAIEAETKAKADAEAILADANAQRAASAAAIAAERQQHQSWIDATKAELVDKKAEIEQKLAQATAENARLNAAISEARAAKAAADDAKAAAVAQSSRAVAIQKSAADLVAKLQEMIGALPTG